MKQHRNVYYSTLQIRKDIKQQLADYCDLTGQKLSRVVENLFLNFVSGSWSGSSFPQFRGGKNI